MFYLKPKFYFIHFSHWNKYVFLVYILLAKLLTWSLNFIILACNLIPYTPSFHIIWSFSKKKKNILN